MPVQTSPQLLAEVRRLRLLPDSGTLPSRVAMGTDTPPPELLARVLIDAGLTPFQTQAVLDGQADRLVFGPYVLLDKLGEGGMGVVYKARHVKLGRIDALKLLRAEKVSSITVVRRFLREIQLTSNLTHAHIVRAYDAGVTAGQLWLATEYVEGSDLGTIVLRRGPLSVADACLAVYQTALALRHIHEKGLVHRDLKPSNLIRDSVTGAVKLLDLGLTGFHRTATRPNGSGSGILTYDGVLLGTPDFIAPEQIDNAHAVDIRADLYSLGCTFYFLLTGRVPYSGTQVERLCQHTFAPPPPLVLPSGTPPPGLAALVARLMAKNPEHRFRDPQALIDALLALRPGAECTHAVADHNAGLLSVGSDSSQGSSGVFAHLLSSCGSAHVPALANLRPDQGVMWWIVGSIATLVTAGLIATILLVSNRSVGSDAMTIPSPALRR